MRNASAAAPITEAELNAEVEAIIAEQDRERRREARVDALNRIAYQRAIPRWREEGKAQLRNDRCSIIEDVWPEALAALHLQIGEGPIYYVGGAFELDKDGVYAKRSVAGGGYDRKKLSSPLVVNRDRAAVLDRNGEWQTLDLPSEFKAARAALVGAGVVLSTQTFAATSQPDIQSGKQPVPVAAYLGQYLEALRAR